MLISKNPWILALQLLIIQLFFYFLITINIRLMKKWFAISFIGFGIDPIKTLLYLILFILISTSLPSLFIGYFYAKKFDEKISEKNKRFTALINSLLLLLVFIMKFFYSKPKFAYNEIIWIVFIYSIIFLLFYFITFYFLSFGDSYYLKRHKA